MLDTRTLDSRGMFLAVAEVFARRTAYEEIVDQLEAILRVHLAARAVSVDLHSTPAPANGIAVVGDGDRLIVPLVLDGLEIGRVTIHGSELNSVAETSAALELLAFPIAAGLGLKGRDQRATQLQEIAGTDSLTGIANRRTFDDRADDAWSRCADKGLPLAIVFIDVDFFKLFNDRYGHVAGDECLRRVAETLAGCAKRTDDIVARYGGEEFAVVLSNTTLSGAVAIAERMRAALKRLAMPHRGSSLGRISVSIGVAAVVPDGAGKLTQLISAADHALYRAKLLGRNCVCGEDYRSAADPIHKRARVSASIPDNATRFFGREVELEQIAIVLHDHHTITLVGPGGVGKTRLAQRAAALQFDRFVDGVIYVDLAVVPAGGDITPALEAATTTAHPQAKAPACLTESFRGQDLLVILDNCEHVLAQCATTIAQLRAEHPTLTFLSASRIPLDLADEITIRVAPLQQCDAVSLFIDCARRADPGFVGDESDRPTVARIVRRLDGLPLAIELAAPRLRAMSPSALLAHLHDHLDLFIDDQRLMPSERTVGSTIAWSYRNLDDDERCAYEALSVFRGSFSLEHAQALLSARSEGADASELLRRLVKKSMIGAERIGGRDRYRLLEILRQYGCNRLSEQGRLDDVLRAHAYHFAAQAEQFDTIDKSNPISRWLRHVDLDLEEYEAAIAWLIRAPDDCNQVAKIVVLLNRYYTIHGSFDAAMRWYVRIEEVKDSLHPPIRARLAIAHATTAMAAGRIDEGIRSAREALELYRAMDNRQRVGVALGGLGQGLAYSGDFDAAYGLLEDALAILREGHDLRGRALVLASLGYVDNEYFRRPDRARAWLEEAIATFRELDDVVWLPLALEYMAESHRQLGQMDAAVSSAREALALADSIGNSPRALAALSKLAFLEAARGNGSEARKLLRGFIDRYRSMKEAQVSHLTFIYENLARAAHSLGDAERAAWFGAALTSHAERSELKPSPRLIEELAAIIDENATRRTQTLRAPEILAEVLLV